MPGTSWTHAAAAIGLMLGWLACSTPDGATPAGEANATEPVAASEGVVASPPRETQRQAVPEPEPEPALARELPPRPPVAVVAVPDRAQAGTCPRRRERDVGLLVSPRQAAAGRPIRVLAATLASEQTLALRVESESGEPIAVQSVHRGGVPSSVAASFVVENPGTYHVIVGRAGEGLRCQKIWVGARGSRRTLPEPDLERVWASERAWDGAEEALYSAWVRELFHAPPGDDLAFSALDELTMDAQRNLLHEYFGWGEDTRAGGLRLQPDCADTPYFLRGYFAWKRGLPFGFRTCSRGHAEAPRCFDLRTTASAPDLKPSWVDHSEPFDHLRVIERFFRRSLAWGVHTGNGRTAHGDGASDLYPVRLDRRGLRPGIVYADPYGHIFVIVDVVEQQGAYPGILYAIDGQPDGSITRKRFWEGNFLWNPDPALGGSGFKAFRPLVKAVDGAGVEVLLPVDDETLLARKDYGDVSPEQASLDAETFYDRIERIINPRARDPFVALAEAVLSLAEAARVRVTSVENGRRWQLEHPGEVIEMPWGHDVFETVGPWENFSTPARDLRLLIAMDVVEGFERKVERNPDAYGLEPGPGLTAVLEQLRAFRRQLLARDEYAISYTRSDGALTRLTLVQLFERRAAFEAGYDPNDCVELRWGAPAGSQELASCERQAPPEHRHKMEAYRPWFAERRRPGRGDPGPDVPGVARPEPP